MEDMRKEQEFMRLLQETKKSARRSGGRITRSEIRDMFGTFSLDDEQLAQVEEYLKASRIVVTGNAGDPDALPEEERDFLVSYMSILEDVPHYDDAVMDALRISAMAGEPSAQRELAEQMLHTVVDIARLYTGQGVSMEDLIGAGNEALMSGVTMLGHLDGPQEVDGELGRRIMGGMEDAISMMLDEKAFDREMEDMVNRVAKEAGELARSLGRKVTAGELEKEGGVTMKEIRESIRLTGGKIEDITSQP